MLGDVVLEFDGLISRSEAIDCQCYYNLVSVYNLLQENSLELLLENDDNYYLESYETTTLLNNIDLFIERTVDFDLNAEITLELEVLR